MAVTSGKTGNVKQGNTDVTNVIDWTVNDVSEAKRYCSSDTNGRRTAIAGPGTSDGTFTMLPTPGAPELTPGTSYTLDLYEDGTKKWEVVALVEKLSENVNIDTGDPNKQVYSWVEVSGFTRPS